MTKWAEAERTPVTRVELRRMHLLEWVHSEERLQAAPLLRSLNESTRRELFEGAVTRRFGDRSHVFDVGDEGTSLYFILRGSVRHIIRAEHGPVEVALLQPGEFFGEDGVVTRLGSRPCAALAIGELDLAEFSEVQVARLGAQDPHFLEELQRVYTLRSQAREDMLAFIGRW